MSKDPAILFYTSDFLTATMTWSDEQVGKYIRLLCLQHQKGFLTEKDMIFICKTYDEDIYLKFIKTPEGLFYNERMYKEVLRRKSYSESRSINRKGNKSNSSKKKKHISNISKSYVEHMETETEDENVIITKDKTEISYPWTDERFLQVWNLWKEYKKQQHKFTYKPIGERGALNDLFELSGSKIENALLIIKQSIQKGWKGFFQLQGQFQSMANEYDIDKIMSMVK